MLGPWPGVHLFCLPVAGIRIFINEIYAHKKTLSVNCPGTNQRLDLFLFPPASSRQTSLLYMLSSMVLIFDFPFWFFKGVRTEVVV